MFRAWASDRSRVLARNRLFALSFVIALGFGLASAQASGQDADTRTVLQQPADPATFLFDQHIRPLLETRCLSCHNSELKQSGLDLSTRAGLLRSATPSPRSSPTEDPVSRVPRTENPLLNIQRPEPECIVQKDHSEYHDDGENAIGTSPLIHSI